tara:strand:- start:320 stop:586 length:267 start_codon:yes stop_codon:yes gene_type:complete
MKNFIKNIFKIKVDEHGEDVTWWAVFPAKWDNEKIFGFIEWCEYRYDMNIGIGGGRYWGGAGSQCTDGYRIHRSKTRTLVKQRHYYDI